MTERLEEIEAEIQTAAGSHQELAALESNTSLVSVWGKMKKVFAFVIYNLELLFEQHKAEVIDLIDQTERGSLQWYVDQVKAFQSGDDLIVRDNKLVYETEDVSKRIVKQASVIEMPDGSLRVKAVKEAEEGGGYIPLAIGATEDEVDELGQLKAYLRKVKFAGTKIDVFSEMADGFEANIKIELNPLIFNDDGSLIDPASEDPSPVGTALDNFLHNLPFDGMLYLSELEDALQAVPGVIDIHITDAELNGISFNRKTRSEAGHIVSAGVFLNYVSQDYETD